MYDLSFLWQYLADALAWVSRLDDTARALVIGAVAFLGVLWIGIIVWVARDVASRTRNVLARIISVLLTLALHVFGLFLYLLFRPSHTIAEREELRLEHDLLRQATQPELDESLSCPSCGSEVDGSFRFCPECRAELRRPCPACKKLLDVAWKHCPHCGELTEKPAPEKTVRSAPKKAAKPAPKKRR